MKKESLWGDLSKFSQVITPTIILKEQARILEKETKSILKAKVEVVGDRNSINIWFSIQAPLLKYESLIFTVLHDPFLYPLTLHDELENSQYECRNEDEFRDVLEEVLSSPKLRIMMGNLLSQSAK